MFVVSGLAISGNELFYSGIRDMFLSNTPYISCAKLFNTAEEAAPIVEWYGFMGEKFSVRELSPAELSGIRMEVSRLVAVKNSLCDLMDARVEERPYSILK